MIVPSGKYVKKWQGSYVVEVVLKQAFKARLKEADLPMIPNFSSQIKDLFSGSAQNEKK